MLSIVQKENGNNRYKHTRKKRNLQRNKKRTQTVSSTVIGTVTNGVWLSGCMHIEERRTIERRAAASVRAKRRKRNKTKQKEKNATPEKDNNTTSSRRIQVRATCGYSTMASTSPLALGYPLLGSSRHVQVWAIRPLFRRPAPFPLVLGCSRPPVSADAESSEIVQETHHPLFFVASHAAGALHQLSEHHALSAVSYPPCVFCVCVFFPFILDIKFVGRTSRGHTSSSSSSPLYCLRENISFDTLIRRSSRGHNSRKATQPSHCGTCLILLIFIAKRVQPSLPSSTLRSNFVYPRQISRSPRVGHCMS